MNKKYNVEWGELTNKGRKIEAKDKWDMEDLVDKLYLLGYRDIRVTLICEEELKQKKEQEK